MSTETQLTNDSLTQDLKALELIRKIRRERAEAAVCIAKNEENIRKKERLSAFAIRETASTILHRWNTTLNLLAYNERLTVTAMTQPIFEFEQLQDRLRSSEFAEFAATRREAMATEKVRAVTAAAKTAAAAHEKIVECRK